ncbi:MAG: hypothetical protein D6765_06900 [Bacteroidetes bacterium]|nr:MAG: hypothetical protein D6765_06900 [Bacteroidota bacterium]
MIRPFIWFWLPLTFSLAACTGGGGEGSGFEDCPAGVPQPVFSPRLEALRSHEFRLASQQAIEIVETQAGWTLELTQSGCEKVRQEYFFTLPSEGEKPDPWALAADLFREMAGWDTSLAPLQQWAVVFGQAAEKGVPPNQPIQPEPGHWMKADLVVVGDEMVLRVLLWQA